MSIKTSPIENCPTRRDRPAWERTVPADNCSLFEAEEFCRSLATSHYENFTVATHLVPERLRQDLANVYSFARWSDDLADESISTEEASASLALWRKQLKDCFDGQLHHPVFIALAQTIQHHNLVIEPFLDLLEAFEQDQSVVRYTTRPALLEYCRCSANPVGRIVLALAGCKGDGQIEYSDSICTGLQLINFWQDVKRDHLANRIYLPADDMLRHDVDESMLDATHASHQLVGLLKEEVAWAREFLCYGLPLEKTAPRVLRPAIKMFIRGGLAIADAIERVGFDTLASRPTVSKWTKLRLAGSAWLSMKFGSIFPE